MIDDADSQDEEPGPVTMCIESDGTARPMSEVLRERRRLYLLRPAAEREAAFRVRAGLIGDLHVCTCSWPVVIAETSTGHEEWCTSHKWQVDRALNGGNQIASVHFVPPAAPVRAPRRQKDKS